MSHRLLILLFIAGATIVATYSPAAPAHHRLSKAQCQNLDKRIDALQSRLRQGYSAKQGRRYRETMRKLELQRHRGC